jgi:phenylalanine-4-hydroxylase
MRMSNYIAHKHDSGGYVNFSPEEDATWQLLYERQIKVVQNRACNEYMAGLKKLDLPHDRIPQCPDISAVLRKATGWSVVPVEAIIPLDGFFSLLANRQFPAASFIRTREEMDYLQEPDIFHEFFGHCPLLTNQAYADFIQWYGETALKADKRSQSLLGRLFWFTIEFGLIQTPGGLRIFGGGILSSYSETVYSLESDEPLRQDFDVEAILHTPYRYDQIQKKYFIINDIEELYHLKAEKILQLVDNVVERPQADNFVIC